MKVAALLIGTMLLFAVPSVAQAANMFAGPMFAFSGETCGCHIANITTSDKQVRVQMLHVGGLVFDSGVVTLVAGSAGTYFGTNPGLPSYCKFGNASPGSFRASMTCVRNSDGESTVALPAR